MARRGALAAPCLLRALRELLQPASASALSTVQRRCLHLEPQPPPAAAYEPPASFGFDIVHESRRPGSRARVGRLRTPHGTVDTPAFVAVGTNAALKGVDQRQADGAGVQLMFCNTYHLLLCPGPETVAAAGGLHAFMARQGGPLMTDSGGFQVFSLARGGVTADIAAGPAAATPHHDDGDRDGDGDGDGRLATAAAGAAPSRELKAASGVPRGWRDVGQQVLSVTEEGVTFRSYRDGRRVLLTPESSVAVQKQLGADIIIPLDELPGYHTAADELRRSLQRSHRWMARSLAAHRADVRQQAMYAVVHGGTDLELRAASAEHLRQFPYDGWAVGGSLGRDREDLARVLGHTLPLLPRDRPVHLLDSRSIVQSVPTGVDTFDSSFPTKLARHGTLVTAAGARMNVKAAQFERAFRPADEQCGCATCAGGATLAYLHHLWRAHEPVLASLASVHNLFAVNAMMRGIREAILEDRM